jgi:hypothetical protein
MISFDNQHPRLCNRFGTRPEGAAGTRSHRPRNASRIDYRALYRFAHTIVTRKVVERGLLPQRAPFSRGTSGYALNVPLQ